jgi:hypothetical protein
VKVERVVAIDLDGPHGASNISVMLDGQEPLP